MPSPVQCLTRADLRAAVNACRQVRDDFIKDSRDTRDMLDNETGRAMALDELQTAHYWSRVAVRIERAA